MWAVFVNVFTVIAGSLMGLLARNLISKKLSDAIMVGIGACTVYIGISGAMTGTNTLVLVIAMAVGGAVGTALDLDGKLNGLGSAVEKLLARLPGHAEQGNAVEAFVSASLLFCMGSMTIVGSLNAGLSGDYELLYTKSVLDLISSAMLAASLGVGVLFSAVFVLVFQGGICLLAGVVAPFLGEYARGELICAGSVVIMLMGFNILGMTKIKVANYLPALLAAPLLCLIL